MTLSTADYAIVVDGLLTVAHNRLFAGRSGHRPEPTCS